MKNTVSWILRGVSLVRTDVSEESSISTIRVTRIVELGAPLAITSNRRTLRRNTVLTRATWRNIPEDGILNDNNVGDYDVYDGNNKIMMKVLFRGLNLRPCDLS
jgi:hypothetical protein